MQSSPKRQYRSTSLQVILFEQLQSSIKKNCERSHQYVLGSKLISLTTDRIRRPSSVLIICKTLSRQCLIHSMTTVSCHLQHLLLQGAVDEYQIRWIAVHAIRANGLNVRAKSDPEVPDGKQTGGCGDPSSEPLQTMITLPHTQTYLCSLFCGTPLDGSRRSCRSSTCVRSRSTPVLEVRKLSACSMVSNTTRRSIAI